MPQQKYYHAYDDRYRQVHEQNLQWSHENPSQIVAEAIATFAISRQHRLLEIGCGEGRDAFPLLEQGYDLLATDVSPEAIAFWPGASGLLMQTASGWSIAFLACLTEPLILSTLSQSCICWFQMRIGTLSIPSSGII